MPFDSNGVFTRVMNWTSDQQNGIAIECGRHDAEDDNFAEGFNDCFCRDGRAVATGDFNLGNYKVKNLANGTASTDAVNKGQMETSLATKANDSSVVHKTGDERITGSKTFYSNTGPIRIGNPDVERGVATASEIYTVLRFEDKDGNVMGVCESRQAPDGAVDMRFNVWNNDYSPYSMGLRRYSNGTEYGYCPPSDAVGSIVTTEGINKNQNGFVKLGNGITLQWGRYDNGVNSAGIKGTITLPTPFVSTAYSFSLVGTRANDEDITAAVNCEGRWKSTTAIGFQCSRTSGSSAGIRYIDWVAIGY